MRAPRLHRLLSKSPIDATGLCAECGPVRLVKMNRGGRCVNAVEQQRGSHGKEPHGLTAPQATDLRAWWKTCDICGRPVETVDHDHGDGELRGCLCRVCNRWLAMVESGEMDSWMRAARAYLDRGWPFGTPSRD